MEEDGDDETVVGMGVVVVGVVGWDMVAWTIRLESRCCLARIVDYEIVPHSNLVRSVEWHLSSVVMGLETDSCGKPHGLHPPYLYMMPCWKWNRQR